MHALKPFSDYWCEHDLQLVRIVPTNHTSTIIWTEIWQMLLASRRVRHYKVDGSFIHMVRSLERFVLRLLLLMLQNIRGIHAQYIDKHKSYNSLPEYSLLICCNDLLTDIRTQFPKKKPQGSYVLFGRDACRY